MSYNKCFMRKTITVLLMVVAFLTTFSIITFAQETQTVHTEEKQIKYVSSKDVNLVFKKYVKNFKDVPDSVYVTKSQLYEAISNSSKEKEPEDILPLKIVLELRNHPEDLIKENDLNMYIDELEENEVNKELKGFRNEAFLYLIVIVLAIIFFA